MSDLAPTYAFEGDEVFAILDGQVIASGADLEEVETRASERVVAIRETREAEKRETAKRTATHIVTPNGIKGTILGRVSSTWGESVTARFENGEIRSFETEGREVEWINEATQKTAAGNTIDKYLAELDAEYEHDKKSLKARFEQLSNLSREVSQRIAAGVSDADKIKLDEIRVQADAEAQEVREAYDYLEEADDAIAPPAPYDLHAAEQATVGVRDDGSTWLDATVEDMRAEAEGVDYEKLLDEEPVLFATELPDAVIADQGATAEMALAHVTDKTATVASSDDIGEYRKLFVARVEQARRQELKDRATTTKREAAAKQESTDNLPDDAFFL